MAAPAERSQAQGIAIVAPRPRGTTAAPTRTTAIAMSPRYAAPGATPSRAETCPATADNVAIIKGDNQTLFVPPQP